MIKSLLSLLLLTIHLIFSPVVSAEDLELINRPINTSGLTGLLFTSSPFTLTPGVVEFGVSTISENSAAPDYTITEYPVSITSGLAHNMEIAVKNAYFQKKEGVSNRKRGEGDIELSYKWNFLQQPEYSASPAIAFIATGIAPTANDDFKMNGVNHWGARIGFSAGSEITWRDHVLGCYADTQLAIQDLSDERVRDRYGLFNAGLLFPISKYRNLQMLVEYNMVNGRRKLGVESANYTAYTYGLRLVTERFNFSMGTQFLHKQVEQSNNSGKVIGTISMKF